MTQVEYEYFVVVVVIVNGVFGLGMSLEAFLLLWRVRLTSPAKVAFTFIAIFFLVLTTTRFAFAFSSDYQVRTILATLSTLLALALLFFMHLSRQALEKAQAKNREQKILLNEVAATLLEKNETFENIIKNAE